MQKPLLILLILLFKSLVVFSQFAGYPVSLINDSLKLNANAVIREETIEYAYLSPTKNVKKFREVVTVLNKNGDRNAAFIDYYDGSRSIEGIKGNIYDANGSLIRKIKASDISDISGSAGYSEFDDIRYKAFKPLISNYPYTVEFEYEVNISGSYSFPRWMAFDGYNVSIEMTSLKIIVPLEYEFNYKEFNLDDGQPVIIKDEKNKTFTWNTENTPAINEESFSDDLIKYVETVYTTPSEFSLSGYPGKMNTWDDYANWQQKLNKGRDELTDARVNEIKAMVKDIPEDRDKVKHLYKYLQGRTRYFGIQLGIGGLQPMDAKVVDAVGYSDCKGLSNYMKALLKAIDIKSYYTTANAGDDFPQMIPDFPSHQSNHVILCVPLKNDTIWLECTSQIAPFGFLGDFTSDRQVLLIKDEGGELVRTPVYSLEENFQYTRASVTITPDGNGTAEISRRFGGLQFGDKLGKLNSDVKDQKEWLYGYYPIPNFQLNTYEFKKDPNDKPESVLTSSMNLSNYSSLSGKRLFLPLNLTNRFSYVPPKVKNRVFDIKRVTSYIDADTIEYNLPEGMEIEFLPENRYIKTPFGEYLSRVENIDGKIIFIRQVKMFKGIYPKEKYDDFVKFFYDISIADKCQAILIKKER